MLLALYVYVTSMRNLSVQIEVADNSFQCLANCLTGVRAAESRECRESGALDLRLCTVTARYEWHFGLSTYQ